MPRARDRQRQQYRMIAKRRSRTQITVIQLWGVSNSEKPTSDGNRYPLKDSNIVTSTSIVIAIFFHIVEMFVVTSFRDSETGKKLAGSKKAHAHLLTKSYFGS